MKINIKNSDETQATINYQRSDKFFRAKNIIGTNLRKLFTGLAIEVARAEGKLQEISDQYDPTTTTQLLSEWEKAIGIPDDCIPLKTDPDDRRNNILLKLTALGVSTKEGFEALGAQLGFTIVVKPGKDALTFPYAFPFIMVNENARWVMYVEGSAAIASSGFTYTFPFAFGDDGTLILRQLFEKLVPATCSVVFNFI